MKNPWMLAAMVVHAAMLGCGAIVEVPVASTSETSGTGEPGESEASDERGSESSAGSSGADTELPDIDGASSSGPTGDEGSSDGGSTKALPFCHEGEGAYDIPEDGSWLEAAIEVPAGEEASMLAVSLRLAHARVSDLRIRLRAPDGTLTSLLDEPACDQPHVDAWFEDGAELLGNEQCRMDGLAAIHGPVAALDELMPLLRSPVDGSWTLEVTDVVEGERGTLDHVCVVLTVEAR